MKRIFLILTLLFLFASLYYAGYAGDVPVRGYHRKDGTYVRPHHRSSPDGDPSNNYGRPSYQQRKQYENSPVLPTYRYDYDSDGITNQYDRDDDNDGISDNYDSRPYNPKIYFQPVYTPTKPIYTPSQPIYTPPTYRPSTSIYDSNDEDYFGDNDNSEYDLDDEW